MRGGILSLPCGHSVQAQTTTLKTVGVQQETLTQLMRTITIITSSNNSHIWVTTVAGLLITKLYVTEERIIIYIVNSISSSLTNQHTTQSHHSSLDSRFEQAKRMMNLGTLSLTTTKSSKPMVRLSFSIPYFTHWGQSLLRKLVVPETLSGGGESVQLRDLWQSGDQALPFRSAFKDVIFRNTGDVEVGKPLGVFENKSDQDDSVVVQFKICCPDVGEGTSVYVLGTSGKLGKWKVEGGLRLKYVGDSMWEADCLIPKADFPIKYPFLCFQSILWQIFHISYASFHVGFLTVISRIDTVKFRRTIA
ncbi:hypothetical protein HA466_0072840 [Hirschfeldia incana]|nr:hypothetical protein HA466_0072840 [Hirschfeldia incana]